MADQIRINSEQMENLSAQLIKLSSALEAMGSQVRNIRIDKKSGSDVVVTIPTERLSCCGSTMHGNTVTECLSGIAECINSTGAFTLRLRQNLDKALDLFTACEKSLVNEFQSLPLPDVLMEGIAKSLGYPSDQRQWSAEMHTKVNQIIKNAAVHRDGELTLIVTEDRHMLIGPDGLIADQERKSGLSGKTTTTRIYNGQSYTKVDQEFGLLDGIKYKNKLLKPNEIGNYGAYDPKTGEKVESKKETGQRIGLFSIGAATSISESILSENQTYEDGKTTAQLETSLGKAEGTASLKGGMGAYVPGEDGKNKLYYGIEGKIGVSASAIDVDASMEYELCDHVEVGVTSEVTVSEAKLEAEGSLGFIDGQFEARAKGSAELNAFSADLEGSLDMGVVEGKLGGSVTIGIGGHADVGIEGGVVKFDIGVAAGLGISVNAELDFSGAIDTVGDVCNAVTEGWDSFVNLWS